MLYQKDSKVTLLMKNTNSFQKSEDAILYIRYLIHLINTKEIDRNNDIILKGYVFHHEDLCPNEQCFLK